MKKKIQTDKIVLSESGNYQHTEYSSFPSDYIVHTLYRLYTEGTRSVFDLHFWMFQEQMGEIQ